MTPRRHWSIRFYPKAWRDRYGDELTALIAQEGGGWRVATDMLKIALTAHVRQIFNQGGSVMETYPHSVLTLARKRSAVVPLAMSLAAFAAVVISAEMFGAHRSADEGALAHIFQLLIGLQIPLLAFFAFKWMRRDAKSALSILALQVAAIGLALLPVWYYQL